MPKFSIFGQKFFNKKKVLKQFFVCQNSGVGNCLLFRLSPFCHDITVNSYFVIN